MTAAVTIDRIPPSPALVSQKAAQRLPKWPLALLCLAYLMPGLLGRDPWKSADITAFGYMASIARGDSPWWVPTLSGAVDPHNLLPYSIGALFIQAFGTYLGEPLAARLPFALMLGAILWMTRRASFFLACTGAAQPAAFAFGGEASSHDYAHAIADGALLALIASLGLLQLGHETTPELMQLLGATLFLLGLSAAPSHQTLSRWATVLSLPTVAASGAPSIALMLGLIGLIVCWPSTFANARNLRLWIMVGTALSSAYASVMGLWQWRWGDEHAAGQIIRLLAWFTWPSWPLVLWTLWRWRHHWNRRHIAIPGLLMLMTIGASIFMGGNDRVLMLGLPATAVLAAFALPTLRRDMSAAIDWFSLCFFSFWVLVVWVVYLSLVTGWPAKPAQNVVRLLPGLPEITAPLIPTTLALLGSLAWLALLIWRGGRRHHPLWTSLVLPASGVALVWLLVMSLLLPVVNYARSYAPFIHSIMSVVEPQPVCIGVNAKPALVAALELHSPYKIVQPDTSQAHACGWQLVSWPIQQTVVPPASEKWTIVARVRRPGDKDESVIVYKRTASGH